MNTNLSPILHIYCDYYYLNMIIAFGIYKDSKVIQLTIVSYFSQSHSFLD